MENVQPIRPEGTGVSAEITRLGEVCERLEGAEPDERARMLAYINSRFGVPRQPRTSGRRGRGS
ncbi:MAG: hypothetical protein AB7G65_19315 [Thermoleophilia bacterium]